MGYFLKSIVCLTQTAVLGIITPLLSWVLMSISLRPNHHFQRVQWCSLKVSKCRGQALLTRRVFLRRRGRTAKLGNVMYSDGLLFSSFQRFFGHPYHYAPVLCKCQQLRFEDRNHRLSFSSCLLLSQRIGSQRLLDLKGKRPSHVALSTVSFTEQ